MNFKDQLKNVLSVSAASIALLQSDSASHASLPPEQQQTIDAALDAAKDQINTDKLVFMPSDALTPGFKVAGHRSHSSHSSHRSHVSGYSAPARPPAPVYRYNPSPAPSYSVTPAPTPQNQLTEPALSANSVPVLNLGTTATTNKVSAPSAPPGEAKILVEEDPTVKSQLKQADAGFAPAQYVIGVRYLTGTGLPVDKQKGKKYLELAGVQGHAKAKERLHELRELEGK